MGDFVITETTGAQRELRLYESAKPELGVTLGGVHREKLTWYPSNATASSQSLGATEDPIQFAGQLSDHVLGTGEAQRLKALGDQIRKAGRECILEFDDDIRVGRLTEWRYIPIVEGSEYDYEGVFSVHSADLVREPVVMESTLYSPEARMTSLLATISRLGSLEPRHIDAGLLSTINTRIQSIRDLYNDIETAIDNPQAFAPSQARQVVSMLTDMQRLARQTRDIAGSVEPTTSNFTVLGALDIIGGGAYFGGLMRDTASLIAVCEQQREAFAHIANTPARRLHSAKAGQNLMAISLIHYGTGLEWQRIAEANRLSTHEVEGGVVLIIPEIQTRPRERRR